MKYFLLLAIFIVAVVAPLSSHESPQVVAAIAPPYPVIARTAHVGGEISVEVSIDSSGKVISAKASGGHPLLISAAQEAAKQWRFVSASDASANRTATLIFTFQIMPRCAQVTDLTPIFYPPYKVEVRGEKPPITCDDCSPAKQEKLRCQNP